MQFAVQKVTLTFRTCGSDTPPHADGPARRLASMPQADRPGCPDPKAVEMDMGLLVEGLLDRVLEGRRLEFHSDEYPADQRHSFLPAGDS